MITLHVALLPTAEPNGLTSTQQVPTAAAGAPSQHHRLKRCLIDLPQQHQSMEAQPRAAAAPSSTTQAQVACTAATWRQQQHHAQARSQLEPQPEPQPSKPCEHESQRLCAQYTATLDATSTGAAAVPTAALVHCNTRWQQQHSTAARPAAAASVAWTAAGTACQQHTHSWCCQWCPKATI